MARKVHPNNPALRNQEITQRLFDSARKPAACQVGRNLRSSADAIFDRERPVATKFWNERRRVPNTPVEKFDFAEFPLPNLEGFHLLIAYAIENFLKGLIVAKGKVEFTDQRKLPSRLKTHNLSKLNELAAPSATIVAHSLDALTYMAEWRARYPMPNSVDQFWPMRPDGTPIFIGFKWPGSYCEILQYCDLIQEELHTSVTLESA